MTESLGPVFQAGPSEQTGALLLPPVQVYPERHDPRPHWLDPFESSIKMGFNAIAAPIRRWRLHRMASQIDRAGSAVALMSDAELDRETTNVRRALRRDGLIDAVIVRAFSLIREHAHRALGLRPHKVQLLGGLAVLDGALAEMDTGEGKTLASTLAAGTAAMAGIPVHVVTVSDYLAVRDAETMIPLYSRLGLTTGIIRQGLTPDQRRQAYVCDIAYAASKEISFDYLRDRVKLGGHPGNAHLKVERLRRKESGQTVMRGLHFAIVDEADSVLIDEARTPLILSRETDAEAERAWAEQAMALADALKEGTDFRLIRDERLIELTEVGRTRLEAMGDQIGGIWQNKIRRNQAAQQALSARLLFDRGDHYLVRDGKVVIVDEYTGRVMEDRSWSDGLHQLVECKEGVEVTSRKETIARMTFQRFFRRYRRLAGMTGTAREVAGELWAVYRLRVVTVPTNKPSRRQALPDQILRTEAEKLSQIVNRAIRLHFDGRAVLIGTRSVNASEAVSEELEAAGLHHDVLNANDESREAEIIANAGAPGRVTVATNMAGRGIDIGLGPGVEDAGGLHVILSERHDSRRIDRQLEGRTARRGEPGSTEAILSLDDQLLALTKTSPLNHIASLGSPIGRLAAHALFRQAQGRAERAHSRARRILLDQDRRLGTILAFSGKQE